MSNVVPLMHGHLANLAVRDRIEETRMAAKLQNIWRGNKSRERAEGAARLQAFKEARRRAAQGSLSRV